MWGLVNKNKVTEIIKMPRSITINDVTHPKSIFGAWSWSELNAIGIYTVEPGKKGNDRFEITSGPTYAFDSTNKKITTSYKISDMPLDDVPATNEDGSKILDSEGNQVINYGLKTLAKNKAKTKAHALINELSWLVERSIYDSSKKIPDLVKNYVTAIRKDCSDIETAIDNAKDMAAFKALYADEFNSDGSLKTINRIDRWTSESTVKDYLR
tara:strand:- start:52 stop:687 length:636 start_codon:yes stop_codon:yes gene_type:complete